MGTTIHKMYYNGAMRTVQARLDAEAEAVLDRLVQHFGWTTSEVVRHALRLMAASEMRTGRRRIAGIGQFASGRSDLGSNPEHLRRFGR